MEQTTQQTDVLRTLSNQMADAVEKVSKALVLVHGRERQGASGIVYAQDLVLTAEHVLERSEGITIETSDNRTLPAQVVGRDRVSDLALLRVAGLGLEPAQTASETPRVGQWVMAVGRSSGEGPTASSGVVSALGGPLRTQSGIALQRYIRTDAIPYPGFSGGPLIDARGDVLGILTTGLVNGMALAIPLDVAKGIADILLNQGSVKRGYLGFGSQLIDVPEAQRAGRTQEHGLLIVKVDEQSPAQRGGLLVGDILVEIDGHAITDAEDLQMLLTGERVGKTVPVVVIRGNVLQTLQITVGQRS